MSKLISNSTPTTVTITIEATTTITRLAIMATIITIEADHLIKIQITIIIIQTTATIVGEEMEATGATTPPTPGGNNIEHKYQRSILKI